MVGYYATPPTNPLPYPYPATPGQCAALLAGSPRVLSSHSTGYSLGLWTVLRMERCIPARRVIFDTAISGRERQTTAICRHSVTSYNLRNAKCIGDSPTL